MTLTVRPMQAKDIPACLTIINHIIAAGGTTAYQEPYTEQRLQDTYLNGAAVSHVALSDGRVTGFQAAFDIGNGDLSVGSFADQQNPAKGTGRALIAATIPAAKAAGFTRILAKITADNTPGLAYYTSVGFTDIDLIKADTTRDGKPLDRVIKALIL